jgi:predicted regulator of Ras-like GTPase activity (Roadblock/LC7/MglB family)
VKDVPTNNFDHVLEGLFAEPDIIGTVLVSHDGIILANDLPEEYDFESVAIIGLGIFINSSSIARKMRCHRVEQVVLQTTLGYLVLADAGDVVVVTLRKAPAMSAPP